MKKADGYGEKVLKMPMSKIKAHIKKLGEIEDLRMAGRHEEAAALQAEYFPHTTYRDVVKPVSICTGNKPA
jgi:hypothetical protein